MDLNNVVSTSEASKYCFELFTKTNNQETKDELRRIIELADNLGEAVLSTEIYVNNEQQDAISKNIGSVILKELADINLILDEEISPDRQRLIDSFEKGVEAFFPEGISTTYKTELFALAEKGYRRPNGKSKENADTYNSRKLLIKELLGKTYESDKFYHGVSIVDLFETADWLYGGTDEEYLEQKWSIDPRLPYQLNPQLLRYSKETIKSTSTRLSQHVGVAIPDILVSAARGHYRYLQSPVQIQKEIEQLKKLGITNTELRKEPDILNYPLKVLLQKEKDYLSMGIPRNVIHDSEKFFVYNPETIKERIQLLDTFIDRLEATVIDKESADKAKVVIRSNKALILEFGKDRIKLNTDLFLKYSHDYNWNKVLEETSQLTNNALKAIFYNILKAKPKEFKDYMEQNPEEDIYCVARKLVNKNKSRK